MESGRDYWYHDLMGLPVARSAAGQSRCETEENGFRGPIIHCCTLPAPPKTKAILHTHGGYMVGVATTLKMVFDLKEEDRYWVYG